MSMEDFILFLEWAVTISAGTVFLLLVSIYLYFDSRHRRRDTKRATRDFGHLVKDYVFVWILVGLLVFYIISIELDSALVFAAGNIAVEALLIAYLIRNKDKAEQT